MFSKLVLVSLYNEFSNLKNNSDSPNWFGKTQQVNYVLYTQISFSSTTGKKTKSIRTQHWRIPDMIQTLTLMSRTNSQPKDHTEIQIDWK